MIERASIDGALSTLSATPSLLAERTRELSAARARRAPPAGGWSVNDVLAHLRACADVWGGNIMRILDEQRPRLDGVDPRRWMESTDYPRRAFRSSLAEFTAQRDELMARLAPLDRRDWSRIALVRAWGTVYERPVLYYAERMARHERSHVRQVTRIVRALSKA